jgi:pimeloyl-ACP methyl ester carboxylesterase
MSRRQKRFWLGGLLLLLIVLGGLGGRWLAYERQPLPQAVAALKSDAAVMVAQTPWLTFTPQNRPVTTGFIFYPGGRISFLGYADLLRALAAEGYLVISPRMPLNIVALKPRVADAIIAAHPEIQHWVIGGHSVGGTMAAQYTSQHSNTIAGLVIWASYPADSADLSALDMPMALIYGSLDPAADAEQILPRRRLFPETANFVRIQGGDHHQFGSYAVQADERHATLSRAAQHEQILAATLDVLQRASAGR